MQDPRRLYATEELTRTIRRQGRLQTWIAGLIGRDKSYVTLMLQRKRTITLAHAEVIALALGADVAALFEFADARDLVAEEAIV